MKLNINANSSDLIILIAQLEIGDDREQEEILVQLLNLTASMDYEISKSFLEKLASFLQTAESEYICMMTIWLFAHLVVNEHSAQTIVSLPGLISKILEELSSPVQDVVEKGLLLMNNFTAYSVTLSTLVENDIGKVLSEILDSWDNPQVICATLKPLRNLFLGDPDSQKEFCLSHGVKKLIPFLESPNVELQEETCKLLISLGIKDNLIRKIIVASGVLPPLVNLFSSDSLSVKEVAYKAFTALLLSDETRERITAAYNDLPYLLPLIDLLIESDNDSSSRDPKIQKLQLLVLNILCNVTINSDIANRLAFTGLTSTIVRMIQRGFSNLEKMAESIGVLIRNLAFTDDNRMEFEWCGIKDHLTSMLNYPNQRVQTAVKAALESLEDQIEELDDSVLYPSQPTLPSITQSLNNSSLNEREKKLSEGKKKLLEEQRKLDDEQKRLKEEQDKFNQVLERLQLEHAKTLKLQEELLEKEKALLEKGNEKTPSSSSIPKSLDTEIPKKTQQTTQKLPLEKITQQDQKEKPKEKQPEPKKEADPIKPGNKIPKTPVTQDGSSRSNLENLVHPDQLTNRKLKRTQPKLNLDSYATAVQRADNVRRKKVAEELLNTEIAYIDSLKIIEYIFLRPLSQAIANDKPIISEQEIKGIFGVIEVISRLHTKFLEGLKERVNEKFNDQTRIGDLFLTFWNESGVLKVYSKYIESFDSAISVLAESSQANPKFKEYLLKCKAKPEAKGLDLLSYLVMPVQRIPRYILLLQDLLKHTSPEHVDYESLKEGMTTTKKVADAINESKRDIENKKKMLSIQESFDEGTLKENIVKPTRYFITEGNFVEIKKGGSKYRYLFLFDDLLIISTQKKKKFNFDKQIKLVHVNRILDVPDEKTLKNAIQIVYNTKDVTEEITFSAPTPKEKKQFIEHLQVNVAIQKKSKLNVQKIEMLKTSGSSISAISGDSILEKLLTGRLAQEEMTNQTIEKVIGLVNDAESKKVVVEEGLKLIIGQAYPEEKIRGLMGRVLQDGYLSKALEMDSVIQEVNLYKDIDPSSVTWNVKNVLRQEPSWSAYPGTFQDKPVSVRVFHRNYPSYSFPEFKRQLTLACFLDHDNFWKGYGGHIPENSDPFIVLEPEFDLASNLYDLLSRKKMFVKLWWKLSLSISSAMAKAHSYKITHRNLTPWSLWVSEDFSKIKIMNFTSLKDAEPLRRDPVHQLYIAPELYNSAEYSESTDVFSFAMLLWYSIAKQEPFPGKKNVSELLAKGDRPVLPSYCPKELSKLIEWAWASNPKKRPTFNEIYSYSKQNEVSKF